MTSRLETGKSLTFFTVWRVACSQRTLPFDRGKIVDTVQYSEDGMEPKATFVDSCMYTKDYIYGELELVSRLQPLTISCNKRLHIVKDFSLLIKFVYFC